MIYGNEMIISERREWPYYSTLIVKLNCFAYKCLYITNKSSPNCRKGKYTLKLAT